MDEDKKDFQILENCVKVADILNNTFPLTQSSITINIPLTQYPSLLEEIERIIHIETDPAQNQVTIILENVEFTFIKT